MAAGRKSIAWSDVEIKQRRPVLLEREKLMFEDMPVRYIFHISIVKKLFITLERFENSRLFCSHFYCQKIVHKARATRKL